MNTNPLPEKEVTPLPKIIRSISILLLATTLLSACTSINIDPGGKPTPGIVFTPIAQPTATPVEIIPPSIFEPTYTQPTIAPMEVIQPTFAPRDIVHLGQRWADFSLRFDPLQWEVKPFDDDLSGLQMLAHRTQIGCRITPNRPVGLGADWSLSTEHIILGQLKLEARSFYQNGALIFIGYYNFLNPNGDGAVEVHFDDQSDDCLQAAEALFCSTEVILP